jgi:hypothetical protein
MSNEVTAPIRAGSVRGVIDLTSTANADWNDLTSADFKDSVSGSAIDAGWRFCNISIVNQGSASAFLKYRARTIAGDPTTDELRCYSGSMYSDDLDTLKTVIRTISVKKADAADAVVIVAGFEKD